MLYSVTQCLLCREIFKDCPPGYVENGWRGVLHGFYSFKEFEGYCSVDFLSVMEVNFRMSRCNMFFIFLTCHVYSLYLYLYIQLYFLFCSLK